LKKIGFVFQTFNLLSSLTALENVEMPMILDGTLSASERRQRAICTPGDRYSAQLLLM
jgi:putative ABC transport system ATP-binding protein